MEKGIEEKKIEAVIVEYDLLAKQNNGRLKKRQLIRAVAKRTKANIAFVNKVINNKNF